MIHPIDNQYHYGTVYNFDGKIVGFAISPDICISLTDNDIEKALEKYAVEKVFKNYIVDRERNEVEKEEE